MHSAVKAIVAEVWEPTETKRAKLHEIMRAWRSMTQTTYKERRASVPEMHCAFARNRFKSKGEADPVYLAHYDIEIKRAKTKHCKVWIKMPYRARMPIWLPLRMSKQAESELFATRMRDSRLVYGRDDRLWIHFTVTRDVTPIPPRTVLAVDLGEKRLATTVLLDQASFRDARFYGSRARGIRRHYAWLRTRLGERKLLRVIRKVKNTERRKINTLCHQISHSIVSQAKENMAVIVVGDLKGIRASAKGRRMNRILSAMPYSKLTMQIEYKAAWQGITVIKISERGTSKTCHRCGSKRTSRVAQSVFECKSCGLIYNADLNGAMNIAKRFLEHAFGNGAAGSQPATLPERNLNPDDEERSQVPQSLGDATEPHINAAH